MGSVRQASLSLLPPYKEGCPIPAFFFAHGSPLLMKECTRKFGADISEGSCDGPLAAFLCEFGPFLLDTYSPKAIVVFSAHWETEKGGKIQIAQNDASWQTKNLYYDYYNFNEEMYKLEFKSGGDATIANRVSHVLDCAGIPNEILMNERGLDHGCFVPFKLMFNDHCPIPIIEVSQYVDLEENFKLGSALDDLRREGILLLAGGLTIHTFQDFSAFSAATAAQGYKDFENTLKQGLNQSDGEKRWRAVQDATRLAYYRKAHPRIEHFTPLGIAAGAGKHGSSVVVSDVHGAITAAFGV